MALVIPQITLDNGLIISNSYVRIDSVEGGKNGLSIRSFYFKDHQASEDGLVPLMQEEYIFIPSVDDNSPNFLKQGYEYLKTLPDFVGATDA